MAGRDDHTDTGMSSATLRTRSYLALSFLFVLVALATVAPKARAEAWGQVKANTFTLTTGTEPGQIDEHRLVRFAAGSDGSYYILTESGARESCPALRRLGQIRRQHPLQTAEGRRRHEQSRDGRRERELAVDPLRDRVYVMLVYERREQDEKEEKEEEKSGKPVFPLDEEMSAAGSLYAFEYKSSTKELVARSRKA